ncbi:hypothetical protein LIER_14439 [Lithospermum erythrorhizon]|uniref:Uncharacterized protein n=1 Tax=Lithospermum erythrorhizon TaxID=34254 RepID=A0AAV3Q2E7_LITER
MRGLFTSRAMSSLKFKHPFLFIQRKPSCNNNTNNEVAHVDKVSDGSNSLTKYDAYKEVQNLDFMKAAKILFSDPPKQKKFGCYFILDFVS